MSPRTVVLFLSFVVLSLSQAPNTLFKESGVVAFEGTPFKYSFGPFNVEDTASLTVSEAKLPVAVCIVLAQYGLPNQTQFSEDNCLFYYNSTTFPFTQNVPLRDQSYSIGVYLSDSKAKAGENTTVTVTLDGNICNVGTYWDGTTCQAATPIVPAQHVTETFAKGETKFFTTTVGNYVGTLKLTLASGEISATTSVMWARYNAVPSNLEYDAIDSNGNVTVISPRPGVWVFGVHAAVAGTGTLVLSSEGCGPNSGGAGCVIPVADANFTQTEVVVLQPQTTHYYRVEATTAYPTVISLTTTNTSEALPELLVSYGVIPTKGYADVQNCNRDYCNVVRSITFNVTEGQTEFFIGVFSVLAGNQTYGLWFNSTCVVGCETDNHGTCTVSGQCHCGMDFVGVDCSISNGLGPQYIVLIIIASLVVASAIIGFVAWAYMRRKRANYEIVS